MRYIVIGTSGAGKSTFAAALAQAQGSTYIELDQLFWGPHWQSVPTEQFRAATQQATTPARWVADGNYSAVRDVLWGRGTHIVWLNYGRRTVWPRVLWRTIHRIWQRTPLFHGNRESLRSAFFSRGSIVLWSLTTFTKNRRKYTALRQDPQYGHLQWTEFTHPAQAQAWLTTQHRSD